MKRAAKIVVWLMGILIILVLAGFFILPPVAKALLAKHLSATLGRTVRIEKIHVNPLSLTIDISRFSVKEKDGTRNFFSFDKLVVKLSPASIFKRALILREVRLTKPYVLIVRNKDESYNFMELVNRMKSGPEKKAEPKKSKGGNFLFSINNLEG